MGSTLQLMQITGEKSHPEAIHHALKAYLKQMRKQKLLAMHGQVDIVGNWQALREYELRNTANSLESSQPDSKMQALLNSDFVGSAEGPEDLSANYKAYLYQGLRDKRVST